MISIKVNIFNIQHFSTHDGPGTRTVIFFKGCNLKCSWCHNPESISFKTDLMFYNKECIQCGNCIEVCPYDVHQYIEGQHVLNRDSCNNCLLCADNCYSKALQGVGEAVTVEYLMKEILSQKPYMDHSSGGVTFSGGECMLQFEPLLALLKACKKSGIHTAVDTAGNVDYKLFQSILPFTDLVLYDIKAVDNKLHEEITGASNDQILSNFNSLLKESVEIHVRVPYIPSFNDVDMENIGTYLNNYPVKKILLPYHALGDVKYEALEFKFSNIEELDEKAYLNIKKKYHFE